MAPIKFEEQLKDKLEKRSLSPSSDSWSKLSDRLDAEEKKSKKPLYWWLSIAAGLVLLVAISIQFIKTDQTESAMPTVVEEENKNNNSENFETPIFKVEKEKVIVKSNPDEAKTESKKEDSEILNEPEIIDYKKPVQNNTEYKLAQFENKTNQKTTPEKIEKNQELQKSISEELLIKDAVANALQNLNTQNANVTDREVDSLLKLASKELVKEKILKETSKTVDANRLLMSVQDEMGQSFRSKVFEALKESYETVKTAVAERNN